VPFFDRFDAAPANRLERLKIRLPNFEMNDVTPLPLELLSLGEHGISAFGLDVRYAIGKRGHASTMG
jgi:hypothetical protein